MKNRPMNSIVKGLSNRFLHHFARHCFPSVVRVFLHRLRGVNIGSNVLIGLDVMLDDDGPERITIEDDVFLTYGCMLLTHQRDITSYARNTWVGSLPFKQAPILIKKGAHIGVGVIIMPGVTIGEGAVIGAGAVVTRDIPAYSLAVGVPARVVKEF